jgi:hypothetical protein
VYLAGTTTAADVYTASAGGTAVASVTTDTHGNFAFWVDDGDYGSSQLFKITLSHGDFESKSYDNIIIIPHSLTHLSSDGSDHTFIDQDVTSGSTPTFTGTNFTGIPMAGILSADKTGSDTDLVTGTKGDANDFVMWNGDGDAVGSGLASSEIDYAFVTGNDGSTDVTAAELEELTDGSVTTLHQHWTYGSVNDSLDGTTEELITSIPSTAIEVKILLSGVSIDAANQHVVVQLGDAGGYETTGYTSYVERNSGASAVLSDTDGFHTSLDADTDAAHTMDGVITLTRWDTSEHLWMAQIMTVNSLPLIFYGFGTKTLSEALTSIRLNTQSGTDNFDAGEARVMYRSL